MCSDDDGDEGPGAMQAEVAGLRGVDEAGGVIAAHLEDDAHGEFAECASL